VHRRRAPRLCRGSQTSRSRLAAGWMLPTRTLMGAGSTLQTRRPLMPGAPLSQSGCGPSSTRAAPTWLQWRPPPATTRGPPQCQAARPPPLRMTPPVLTGPVSLPLSARAHRPRAPQARAAAPRRRRLLTRAESAPKAQRLTRRTGLPPATAPAAARVVAYLCWTVSPEGRPGRGRLVRSLSLTGARRRPRAAARGRILLAQLRRPARMRRMHQRRTWSLQVRSGFPEQPRLGHRCGRWGGGVCCHL
jgi:hypothetical protein